MIANASPFRSTIHSTWRDCAPSAMRTPKSWVARSVLYDMSPNTPAAASVTALPRSLGNSVAPILAGYLLGVTTFGWPLILCGGIKIVYDLAFLKTFSAIKPPEEQT